MIHYTDADYANHFVGSLLHVCETFERGVNANQEKFHPDVKKDILALAALVRKSVCDVDPSKTAEDVGGRP
jgi:hypothetical protein